MKPRYNSPSPLPDKRTVYVMAFIVMADHVKAIGQSLRAESGVLDNEVLDPALLTPAQRETHDWVKKTWANVRLTSMALEKGNFE